MESAAARGTEPPAAGGVDAALLERLKRRSAAGAGERRMLDVVVPWTGELLDRVPEANADDIAAAARAAREAQRVWKALPWRERVRPILRLHDLVLERQADAMDLIQAETGKARKDAFEEVADVALVARYYAYHGERHVRSERRRPLFPVLTRTWVHHHPVGLVGFIVPWNYPFTLALSDAIPALLAGNAALVKPDPRTPFSALWAAAMLDEAGVPPDLFQVVPGDGARIGADLIDVVDHLAFTGSTATGRIVAKQAADRLIGCSLELGGKNALIVLEDADLDAAAEGAARACFSCAGQLCVAMERILVQRAVADAFLAKLKSRLEAFNIGSGPGYDVDMGSLVSGDQLRTVEEHVRDAVAKGAAVLTGGKPLPELGPWFYAPTILTGVTPEAELFDMETFGPVVAASVFDTEDEAVDRANASRYGLNASIWSRSVRRARRLGARLQVGTVNINEAYGPTWGSTDAPMGGFKASGSGRRHGAEGILRFTEPQTVAAHRWIPLGPSRLFPGETFRKVFTVVLKLLRRIPGLR